MNSRMSWCGTTLPLSKPSYPAVHVYLPQASGDQRRSNLTATPAACMSGYANRCTPPVSALACDSVAQRAGLDQVAVLDTLDLRTAGAMGNINERYKLCKPCHPQ